jgi:hypothetical protein
MMDGHVSAVRLSLRRQRVLLDAVGPLAGCVEGRGVLLLRHQLAVLQRQQVSRPRLRWSDRALIAALAGVIPQARRAGLRLLVTPDMGFPS